MSREIPAELETAIEQQVVRPFFALFIDLPDPVRAWTGLGLLNYDGEEWLGVGTLGSLETVGEATDGTATGIKAGLYQVPAEFRDDIADQAARGVAFDVHLGAVDEDYTTVLAAQLIFKGRVDEYKVTDAGTSISVEVSGESRAIDQRRPTIRRFSHEWQQRRSPGDLFFEFLPRMAEVSILWAQAEQRPNGITPSGGGFAGATFRGVHHS